MAEYIEREAALDVLCRYCPNDGDCDKNQCAEYLLTRNLPTADVVEVVRCKDCKHCETEYPLKKLGLEAPPVYFCMLGVHPCEVLPTDFCSHGAKMDGKGEGDG